MYSHTPKTTESGLRTEAAPAKSSKSLSTALLACCSGALAITTGSAIAGPLNSAEQGVVTYLTDPNVCNAGYGGPALPPPNVGEGAPQPARAGFDTGQIVNARTVTGGPYTCPANGSPTDAFWTEMGNVLNSSNDTQQHQILQSLAFDQFAAAGRLQTELSSVHRNNLSARIRDLHSGSTGMRTVQAPTIQNGAISMNWNSPYGGGGASADSINSKYGTFISARISTGNRDTTDGETGYDIDGYNVTAGMDYRFTDSFVMGAAVGYASTDADFDANAGEMTVDGYSLSLFGTHYNANSYYIDGIVSYNWNEVDTDRNILQSNTNTLIANSNTDSSIFSASLGVGKEFQMKQAIISPYLRLDYSDVNIDGFTETGAGFWGMQIDDQELTSFTSNLGVQLVNPVSKSWGILTPQFRAEWVHEYDNDSRIIRGRFLGALSSNLNQPILLPTDNPDKDYFNLAVGASAQLANNMSWFVQYEGIYGLSESSLHIFQAGLRAEF